MQLDLPFSKTFYQWLLMEEHSLSLSDLVHVVPEVHRTLSKLQEIVRRKEAIEKDTSLRPHEKAQLIEQLDMDGCSIADIGLIFELPGYENIELRKGGSEIAVTIHNLDQYIKVSELIFFYINILVFSFYLYSIFFSVNSWFCTGSRTRVCFVKWKPSGKVSSPFSPCRISSCSSRRNWKLCFADMLKLADSGTSRLCSSAAERITATHQTREPSDSFSRSCQSTAARSRGNSCSSSLDRPAYQSAVRSFYKFCTT